jgi:prepilin-type N-terminal cleavage/methylation domain-containing protein
MRKRLRSRLRTKAFTLIELLVVIAIIAILAAILFPVFAQARDKARQAACLSNEKQIGTSITMYAQDYDETLPNCNSWGYAWTPAIKDRYIQQLTAPYVKNETIWYCPSVGKDRALTVLDAKVKTYGANGTTYIWNHQTESPSYGPYKGHKSVTWREFRGRLRRRCCGICRTGTASASRGRTMRACNHRTLRASTRPTPTATRSSATSRTAPTSAAAAARTGGTTTPGKATASNRA